MKIAAITPESTIDYPGKMGPVLFASGCNYRCPSCYNAPLEGREIPEEEFQKFLRNLRTKAKAGWYKGITICGGEPTLQHDIPDFIRGFKEMGLMVKLDTNGSNPQMLGRLLGEKLVDCVAMDIKGPQSLYRRLIGLNSGSKFDLRDNVEKAIGVVQNFPDYEFRTTVVPVYDTLSQSCRLKGTGPNVIRWMAPEEAREMAEWVSGFIFTNPKQAKWYVQGFEAKDKMFDEKFSKKELAEEYWRTPTKVLEAFRDALRTRFPNAQIR